MLYTFLSVIKQNSVNAALKHIDGQCNAFLKYML